MSAAPPLAAGEGRVIPLAVRRGRRGARSPRVLKAAAVLALCLLGLIGNFADSAVARTGLLLVDPPYPGGVENVTATLVWAMIANLAVCAGVVMVAYWLLSWPSAQVVELRSRRRKR
jgi:hypothetical protein